jgi:hypothetical protein
MQTCLWENVWNYIVMLVIYRYCGGGVIMMTSWLYFGCCRFESASCHFVFYLSQPLSTGARSGYFRRLLLAYVVTSAKLLLQEKYRIISSDDRVLRIWRSKLMAIPLQYCKNYGDLAANRWVNTSCSVHLADAKAFRTRVVIPTEEMLGDETMSCC